MAKQSQSKIAWPDENFSFGSCFQPLFTWLRCLGVDVQWREQRSQPRRFLARFSLCFWSFINFGLTIIYIFHTIVEIQKSMQLNEKINNFIDVTYASVQIVGIYFALLLATAQYDHRLAESFQQLETHFPNEQKLHDRIRRFSFITVSIILITV